jgi:hypothetical protein
LLEDEPIDGLDILAIEPQLTAQTILDAEDEIGDLTLFREVLTTMLEDFESFGDEESANVFAS